MRTLLETLQQRTDCLYLSDLHTDQFRRQALQEALAVPAEDYPLNQWRDTLSYLLGRVPTTATLGELRAILAAVCAAQ